LKNTKQLLADLPGALLPKVLTVSALSMLSPLRHARACSPPLRQRTYQGSKSTLSTCKLTLSLSLLLRSILDPVH